MAVARRLSRRGGSWLLLAALLTLAETRPGFADEPVVGGPCEGCEWVFRGMPDGMGASARIAPPDEPGNRLLIEGIVRDLVGDPVEGVVVYAYHTDAAGVYPPAATRHGRLRGWARTDAEGRYRFDTIRPGAYPGRTEPQHVHMHVIEPGRCTYYIDDLLFSDDPLLTPQRRRHMVRGRGGEGVATPTRDQDGTWRARRDIVLGRNIPEYPCPRRWTFPVPFYQSISWSPDGQKLAVSAIVSSWDEGYRIYLLDADGGNWRALETGGDRDLYPVWSPDGEQIAFGSTRDDNADLYVVRLEDGRLSRVTQHPARDGYPSWSPDGSQLAFHSNRDGNYEIYVVEMDGSNLRRLTDHPGDDYNPAWSPDGGWIAFDADREEPEGDEIYVISPGGGEARQVVNAGVFPTWSPDGRHLLYADEGLFRVDVDGGNGRRLLDHAIYGAWAPHAAAVVAARIRFDDQCRDQHSLVRVSARGEGDLAVLR